MVFPPAVHSQFTTDSFDEAVLTPGERKLLRGWSPKRVRDFCTGRYCARQALLLVGAPVEDVLVGANREPLWPPGVVGSISHSEKMTGAVVAAVSDYKSIGLDIETVGNVEEHLWPLLFSQAEQEYLRSLPPHRQVVYSTAFFSMKESYYKLQYPVTGHFLDFTDVEIQEETGPRFFIGVVAVGTPKKLLPQRTEVSYVVENDQVISYCTI